MGTAAHTLGTSIDGNAFEQQQRENGNVYCIPNMYKHDSVNVLVMRFYSTHDFDKWYYLAVISLQQRDETTRAFSLRSFY